MTATNHTLTGALIGLTVQQPWLAIPLAFASHFAMDSLPHFNAGDHTKRKFVVVLGLDALMAALTLFLIVLAQPQHWQLGFVCAIAAPSPDLMWFPHWLRELAHKAPKPFNAVERFHSRIQRYEKSYNWPYEVIWFAGATLLLANLI